MWYERDIIHGQTINAHTHTHTGGMRASPTAELVFEDVRVPAKNLVGAATLGGWGEDLFLGWLTLHSDSFGATLGGYVPRYVNTFFIYILAFVYAYSALRRPTELVASQLGRSVLHDLTSACKCC